MAKKKTKKKSTIATAPVDEYRKNKPDLTKRELEVAIQVGLGLTCPEAGEVIGISGETVRSHLASLRNKTGLRRKPQLMLWATLNTRWLHKQLAKAIAS
jgi:DNA-binding CsgD family transcriptional regulator